jgi:hypothetical protein
MLRTLWRLIASVSRHMKQSPWSDPFLDERTAGHLAIMYYMSDNGLLECFVCLGRYALFGMDCYYTGPYRIWSTLPQVIWEDIKYLVWRLTHNTTKVF